VVRVFHVELERITCRLFFGGRRIINRWAAIMLETSSAGVRATTSMGVRDDAQCSWHRYQRLQDF
jgi:hypothetical protein